MGTPDFYERIDESPRSKHVGNVEVRLDAQGLVGSIRLSGKTLILYDDADAIRSQLTHPEGDLPLPPDERLASGISTDAIIAARPDCYYYDAETLGAFPLRTLKIQGQNPITPESIRSGHFAALAAGSDWGCGSSREHAAVALVGAGIGVIYAPSNAPIHRQNLINSGMFPVRDRQVMESLMQGETVGIDQLCAGLNGLEQRMMRRGGFFPFMQAWSQGHETISPIETPHRPMTLTEKIMAQHMDTRHGAVQPGDHGLLRVDSTLCHDYTTAQVAALIELGLGRGPQVQHPDRHHSFPDHLTLIGQGGAGATPEEIGAVVKLRSGQARVARETGIHFHQSTLSDAGGSEGICHQHFREQVVVPGQVLIGTDSHTCSGGTLGAYAIGVGSTHIASAWENDVVLETVPETIHVKLEGTLPEGCSGKDVMLFLAHMAQERAKAKGANGVLMNGRVLEFGGEGLESLSADDQWVLANMATECSAKTGLVTPNRVMRDYLIEQRGMEPETVDALMITADTDAIYADTITIDLNDLVPYVAKPGHTGNGVPLTDVQGIRLDGTYCGSCTAGSIEVVRTFARILKGRHVAVRTYLQAGSRKVLAEATREGLIQILQTAGVTVIDEPGCGACLAAGPGGPAKGEVILSATNRNFPGRMGEGDAYLASPAVVAVAALMGHIPTAEEYRTMSATL